MVTIIAALAVAAVAGSAVHLFWPKKRNISPITRQDIISDDALDGITKLSDAIRQVNDALKNRNVGSYSTGGDMDPAQKERTRQHFIEPATGYNDPAPTQKSKLLFYQGWRICSHKTSTLEHPDGRLMKVETATLWEIRELTRVEREMRDQLAMRAPVGNYTDLPKGEPVKSNEEVLNNWYYAKPSASGVDWKKFSMDIGKGSSSTAWSVHLITDKGNVIVPGTSFLDEEGMKRAHTSYKAAKAMDLVRLLIHKGRKFSPSSNPLGDTAAFSHWNGSISLERGYSFRHRKGGRRG